MAGRCVAWLHVLVAVSVPPPVSAFAQDGAIAGQVLDAAGDPLPGVTVEATDPLLSDQSRLSVTDVQGRYRIPDLRPGLHIVTFKLPGFGTVVRGVELSAGLTAVADAELIVGAIDDLNPLTPLTPPDPLGAFVLNCEFRPDGTIGPCRRSFFTTLNPVPPPAPPSAPR